MHIASYEKAKWPYIKTRRWQRLPSYASLQSSTRHGLLSLSSQDLWSFWLMGSASYEPRIRMETGTPGSIQIRGMAWTMWGIGGILGWWKVKDVFFFSGGKMPTSHNAEGDFIYQIWSVYSESVLNASMWTIQCAHDFCAWRQKVVKVVKGWHLSNLVDKTDSI